MVKKLVRLALASEYQRRPIRRADISEKVLGSQGRQFKTVFERAQTDLQAVFGMELRELPAKDKFTLQQKRGEIVLFSTQVISEMLTINSRRESRQAK
jgi:melanoma-associated antigen